MEQNTSGMAVAYGIGLTPDLTPPLRPFSPAPSLPTYLPALPLGLAEAAETVRVALRDQQQAERTHTEAALALESAKAKYRAAMAHFTEVSAGRPVGSPPAAPYPEMR